MPALPAYVKVMRDGFGEKPESALLRTTVESGPAKQALVRSRVMVQRPVRLRIDALADYLAFKAWFRDTIHRGADWFDWTDPVDSTVKSARFLNGEYEANPGAGMRLWVVKATFETWDS